MIIEGFIFTAFLLFVLSAITGKKNKSKKRGRSFAEMSEDLHNWLNSLDKNGSNSVGVGNAAHPYAEDESQYEPEPWVSMVGEGYGQEGHAAEEHTAASHMQDDEYDYVVEQAYNQQYTAGQASIQGCDTLKDIRIVSRKKTSDKKVVTNVGNEQLLAALNNLPSAIVAAEILGPPRSKIKRGRYTTQSKY